MSEMVPRRVWLEMGVDRIEYIRADLKGMTRPVHPTTEDFVQSNGWTLCAGCPVRDGAEIIARCLNDPPHSHDRQMAKKILEAALRGRPDTAEGGRP